MQSISTKASEPLYLDDAQPIEARVEDLLSRMTAEEKIALIHGDSKFTTAAIERLGIPLRWMSDGPHGVREDVGPHTWRSAGRTDDFATAMPALIGLAATWNVDLAKNYGEVVGEEARARGKDIMLGPSVNIQRTPLCGRNFEYMGEDPWLTARMAVAYIKGMQSRDVAACIKHFAVNNQEHDRMTVNVEVDERALREIYLPAFHDAVKEANVLTFMAAYNKFRGQHCCHNEILLNRILKEEWGFKGLVMSDWSGVHDTREAALFGMDLEMGTVDPATNQEAPYDQYHLAKPFLARIQSGEFPMSLLDDKARRNLYVMFATRVFEPEKRFAGSFNTREHQHTARRIAEESFVLLKNDGAILPLDSSKIRSIAVIGENATRLHSAGGGAAGIKAFYEVSPLQGILKRAGSQVNVTFSQGYQQPPDKPLAGAADGAGVRSQQVQGVPSEPDEALISRAVEAARTADVAVVVGGLNHNRHLDDEGADRFDLKLPYGQDELIRRVVEANPRTIIVLIGGAAVEMDAWLGKTPAVVQAWYPGMEAGNAIASMLFGDVNPGGKLPCTFPRKLADSPAHALGAYPGENGTVEYKEGIYVGYRWFDEKRIDPLFAFGHGLSYTKFDYSNFQIIGDAPDDSPLKVRCRVTNSGSRAGAEVVQLYVRDVKSTLPRPQKELKGFAKVVLAPGESGDVTLDLPRRAFAFYDPGRKKWAVEPGEFEVQIGASSRDIRLKGNLVLEQ